jgi:hypothetical protein
MVLEFRQNPQPQPFRTVNAKQASTPKLKPETLNPNPKHSPETQKDLEEQPKDNVANLYLKLNPYPPIPNPRPQTSDSRPQLPQKDTLESKLQA